MSDYISRAAVEEVLEKAQIISDGENCGYCTQDINITAIPAADVEEIKHGYWIVDICTGKLQCSVCGDDVSCDNKSLYCPNCGATLDERMVFENGCC